MSTRRTHARVGTTPKKGTSSPSSSSTASSSTAESKLGLDIEAPKNQNELEWTNNPVFVTVCVIALVLCCTPFAFLLMHTHIHLDGSIRALLEFLAKNGVSGIATQILSIFPTSFDDKEAWQIIAGFSVIEALLMVLLPGKTFKGPIAASGHVPIYKANGFQHYFAVNVLFWSAWYFDFYDVTRVYAKLVVIIAYLSVVALVLCVFLTLKGIYFPSTEDSGSSGNIFFDFYEGTELYPRICGVDVKVFTNCRFGMIAWCLLPYVYMLQQLDEVGYISYAMAVSVILQEVYIAKFFWWETGYYWSIDIMHDRAGYMICWGCICWVPSVYTAHTLYLVKHSLDLSLPISLAILALGLLGIFFNYDADNQRYIFRQHDGNVKVWGERAKYVQAYYKTEKGDLKGSKLLYSGYWGITRHLQYDFELTAALSWCLPAMFTHALPYLYFVFLFILLTHRAVRDDHKCGMKYGKYWEQYKKIVPYNMIPGVF